MPPSASAIAPIKMRGETLFNLGDEYSVARRRRLNIAAKPFAEPGFGRSQRMTDSRASQISIRDNDGEITRHAAPRYNGPTGCSRCCRMLTTSGYGRICRRSCSNTGKASIEASRPIEHVYFPIDGVASLVITTAEGASAEVGTIGSEGMVGLPVCLGDREAPSAVYVQVPGTALKMDAACFRDQLERSRTLNLIMLRYAHAFFNQVAQSAACAHLHRVEQRCCRWLLMTRDRMPSGDFCSPTNSSGMMLGVRRTTVTDVMGALQKAGLIRYRRGHVTHPRSRGAAAARLRMLRHFETGIRSAAWRYSAGAEDRQEASAGQRSRIERFEQPLLRPISDTALLLGARYHQITVLVHRPGRGAMTATGPTTPRGDPYKGLPAGRLSERPFHPLR